MNAFLPAVQNLFGGGLLLGLAGLRQLRRLAPSSLIGWIIVIFAGYSIATLCVRAYVFYSEEIVKEGKRTETAMRRHAGCEKLPDELDGVQEIEEKCEEYYYIVKTSVYERAKASLAKKLPKTEDLPRLVLSSAENSFFLTTIVLGMGFVVYTLLQPVREKVKDKTLKYRRDELMDELVRQAITKKV